MAAPIMRRLALQVLVAPGVRGMGTGERAGSSSSSGRPSGRATYRRCAWDEGRRGAGPRHGRHNECHRRRPHRPVAAPDAMGRSGAANGEKGRARTGWGDSRPTSPYGTRNPRPARMPNGILFRAPDGWSFVLVVLSELIPLAQGGRSNLSGRPVPPAARSTVSDSPCPPTTPCSFPDLRDGLLWIHAFFPPPGACAGGGILRPQGEAAHGPDELDPVNFRLRVLRFPKQPPTCGASRTWHGPVHATQNAAAGK
jgi:hypothetical protein